MATEDAQTDPPMTSQHPMVTRRREGLPDIFQGIDAEKIKKLRKNFTSRRSTSTKSRLSSKDDDEDVQTSGGDVRQRRSSGRRDNVTSGRVTKVTASSARRRKNGVAFLEGQPEVKNGDAKEATNQRQEK